jgi:hypothetical protein
MYRDQLKLGELGQLQLIFVQEDRLDGQASDSLFVSIVSGERDIYALVGSFG